MRLGLRRKLNPFIEPDFIAERIEKMKASISAKVEHPFRVIKRQFGFTKVRYRRLAKNTAQIVTLFALSNLWMAGRQLRGRRDECVRDTSSGITRCQKHLRNGTTEPQNRPDRRLRRSFAITSLQTTRRTALCRPSLGVFASHLRTRP